MSDNDSGVRGFIRGLYALDKGTPDRDPSPPMNPQAKQNLIFLVVIASVIAIAAIVSAFTDTSGGSGGSTDTRSHCEQMYQDNQATADVPYLSPQENEDRYVNNCLETQREINNGDWNAAN